jgi:hypothetical protein
MDAIKSDVERTLGWVAIESRRLDDAIMHEVRRLIGSFFSANPEARSIWWNQGYDRDREWGGIFIVDRIVFLERTDLLCDAEGAMSEEEVCERLRQDASILEHFEIDDLIAGERGWRHPEAGAPKLSLQHAASIVELLKSPEVGDVLDRKFGAATIRALRGTPAVDDAEVLATLGKAPRSVPYW